MSSKLFLYTVAVLFLVSVAAYVGWRTWHVGELKPSHAIQMLLASGLAVALVKGGKSPRLIAVIVSIGAAISSFRIAFSPLLEGEPTMALLASGIGFSLCTVLVVLQLCLQPDHSSPSNS